MGTLEAEIDAALERAARFKPLPVPLDGQCLRAAVAVCLRRPEIELPLRFEGEEALDWGAEVGRRFGVELVLTFPQDLPPAEIEPWVALVPVGEDHHAIPMIGRRPLLDGNIFPDPAKVMVGGLRIVPAAPGSAAPAAIHDDEVIEP